MTIALASRRKTVLRVIAMFAALSALSGPPAMAADEVQRLNLGTYKLSFPKTWLSRRDVAIVAVGAKGSAKLPTSDPVDVRTIIFVARDSWYATPSFDLPAIIDLSFQAGQYMRVELLKSCSGLTRRQSCKRMPTDLLKWLITCSPEFSYVKTTRMNSEVL